MSQIRLLLVLFVLLSFLSAAYLYLQKNTNEYTEDERMIFEHWKQKYDKLYVSADEEQNRFEIFLSRLRHLSTISKDYSRLSTVKLNSFSDLTHSELILKFSSGHKHGDHHQENETSPENLGTNNSSNETIPLSIDWRELGAVTPIKDQAQCGACWAFSVVVGLEGLYSIKNNVSAQNLSVQQLIDCSHLGPNSGCVGGDPVYGYDYVKSTGGVMSDDSYPFNNSEGKCHRNQSLFALSISNHVHVPENDNDALLRAVAQQPVSVCIDDSSLDFYHYNNGVFNSTCGTELGHCLAIVGYGTENGVDYWIIKNSWGTDWGINGYAKMIRQKGIGPGICGIAMEAVYPVA